MCKSMPKAMLTYIYYLSKLFRRNHAGQVVPVAVIGFTGWGLVPWHLALSCP